MEMGWHPLVDKIQAIRCDHDGLKMAEVQNGHLILRTKHHGETHVKVVPLAELAGLRGCDAVVRSQVSSRLSR